MTNPIGWFEIYVQDMPRAKAFYQQVFQRGFSPISDTGAVQMWSFDNDMQNYGSGGALVRIDGMPSGNNSTIVYFQCEDCSVEQGRVEQAGGKVYRAKMAIGEYGFVSLVKDPDGNLLGLHSMQ
ncbi:VOC family protein [Bowmanella sp. JS7-9]|uniref:VOC family protein n=1 Tax=Pseudobowmanella zhangzhouensis TaxID=1537679 RepID=A0ABW1XQ00_9ALTE|nr:VOC family protein [Bowmanella sp. JS7-9]TBX23704.1 lactoylglutathione lyase [Bowmanella sp. JS7-9]